MQYMKQEKELTELESLQLIGQMIQKAKGGVNQNGVGALLWGTVVALAGLLSFIKIQFELYYAWFDPWMLCLFALIPQIFIVRQERKAKRLAKRYEEDIINAVWTVYGFSIFMLVFYFNLIPLATEKILAANNHRVVLQAISTGEVLDTSYVTVFSQISLLLILFSIPTLITGLGTKNKPMLFGGLINVVLFIVSLYTVTKYDNLLASVVAICNWFIPGLLMRKQYLQQKNAPANV